MSYLKECDVFVRNLQMHVINMKLEKNKDQLSCPLGFPILLFLFYATGNLMCSFRVWSLGRMWNSIASVLIIASFIYFAQIGTFSCTQVHKIE